MHGVASAIQLPPLELILDWKCTFLKDSGVLSAYIFRILAIHVCRAIVETSHVLMFLLPPKRVSRHCNGNGNGETGEGKGEVLIISIWLFEYEPK